MRTSLWRLTVTITGVCLAGCVVNIGRHQGKTEREVVTKEIRVVPGGTEEAATAAEIEAAGQLSFDPERAKALKRIAERPTLTPPTQVHLVNTTLKHLDFEPSKAEVLMALIKNPAFSTAAKETILRQLNQLDFEPTKAAILEAIQKRSEGK